ncbi:uncharacterized protein A4U43_C07F23640 [Asparagus officinalis]|uniref:Uncharacterized protein n=1 Tax=Asparagus officinalis TaxID=4686 RepID=A0A5P1EEC7_ASPOF|nr:uncharacterized protein A4U43_C07F23640 [Asparagus officinalis]
MGDLKYLGMYAGIVGGKNFEERSNFDGDSTSLELQESGWEELRKEARKIEGDLDVKLSSYAKLGTRFTQSPGTQLLAIDVAAAIGLIKRARTSDELTEKEILRCLIPPVVGPQPAGMGLLVTQLNRLENVGLVNEYSPGRETMALAIEDDAVSPSSMPKSSRHPGKEPIRVDDDIEGRARTPSDQMKNGAGGRILEDMPSVDIHQALQACFAQGSLLE